VGSILAIVSKAMFDREAKRAAARVGRGGVAALLGQTLDIDRYISRGPALAPLHDGGSLVLVTVRPGDETIWLVAILDDPKLGDDGYVARRPNRAPLTDVTEIVREHLKAYVGKLPKRGRVAMSLQTPRQLEPTWVERFRKAAQSAEEKEEEEEEREEEEEEEEEEPIASVPMSLSSVARLPAVLRAPPWKSKGLRAPSPRARAFRLDLASRASRMDWPRHSRDLALGVARLRKCANWREATAREIEIAMARPQAPTGPNRVCLGVLSTLPMDDALDVLRRVPLRSFCHQSSLLLPAVARLGGAMAETIARAAMNKERRVHAFAALEHLGTPLAVPVVLDAIVRVPTLRAAALRWLMRYADVVLVALIPLAVGVVPSSLGLADELYPQSADSLRRAAHRALLRMAASRSVDKNKKIIMKVARDLDLEEDTTACLHVHALAGRRPPTVPRFRDVPRPLIKEVMKEGGKPISSESYVVMLELLALTDWETRSEDIDALEQRLDLRACLETLLAKWIGARATRTQRWILDAACQMADGVVQRRVVDLIRSWRGVYELSSAKAIDALARAAISQRARPAGDRALESLGALAHRSGSGERVATAQRALLHVADVLALPKDTIDDRLVSRLGLDDRGRMELEVAGRKLVARLDSSLVPFLSSVDTHGRITELPRVERRGMRAMETADEREAERWALFRREARIVAEDVAARAERWMRYRKRWIVSDFLTYVVAHPVLREVAAGLVWGVYRAGHGLVDTFRVTEDRTFADASDAPFDVLPVHDEEIVHQEIGVVHPAELDDKAIAAWADVLFNYRIVPVFEQLSWPVVRLTEEKHAATELRRFSNMVVTPALLSTLWTWRQVPMTTTAYEKRLDRKHDGAPLRALLLLESRGSGHLFAQIVRTIRVQHFAELSNDDQHWLTWSEVDPVSASEMLFELGKRVGA
jgi:hypothetical protein